MSRLPQRLIVALVALVALAVVAQAACNERIVPSPPEARTGALDAGTRIVVLAPGVAEAAQLRSERPRRGRLAEELELAGEIVADPDHVAAVGPPVAGRIEAIHARVGASVRRGDVLIELRVPDLARARADLATKVAMSVVARQNAERQRSLFAEHAGSEKEAQSATGEATALDAQAHAAASAIAALGTAPAADVSGSLLALRSPVTGHVIARAAVVGQPVAADQTLITVGDLATVWFAARVYDGDLAHVKVGNAVEVVLGAYPRERFPGFIDHLGEQVDPATHAVGARIILSNPRGLLRLGLFGSARVAMEADGGTAARLVLPEAAVAEVAGDRVVFVRIDDRHYEIRSVTVGAVAHAQVELLSGVSERDDVVTDGAHVLKSVALRAALGED